MKIKENLINRQRSIIQFVVRGVDDDDDSGANVFTVRLSFIKGDNCWNRIYRPLPSNSRQCRVTATKQRYEDCSSSTTIHEGNQGIIAMSKNPVFHKCTKHIIIKFHIAREKIQDKTIELKYCPTHEMATDIFTMFLPRARFETSLDLSWFSYMLSEWKC